MKFTNKFTFITTTVVLTCIALVIAGGLVSLRALTLKYHQQRVDSIIHVIEKQLEKQTTATEFSHWLPDVLDASGIVRLQVKRDDITVYRNFFESRRYYPKDLLLTYTYQLERYPNVTLILETRQPFSDIKFTFWPLLGVSLAVLISLSLLWFALFWIKRSFYGAELLERRARYLLKNNPTARYPQKGEWPKAASKAIDLLCERLENSRKERSLFDTHIRSQAFLDEETGLGNHLAFENRLDAVAMDENFTASTLMLISLSELSLIKYQFGSDEEAKIIEQMVDALKQYCQRYNDSFYGRTQKSEFVIILPQMSNEETEVAAKQLTKLLYQLQLPEESLIEQFFYIGVVNFAFATEPEQIIEEANQALLVAQYQKISGWHLADAETTEKVINKGTVRWRTLLNEVLANKTLLMYQQNVFGRDGSTLLYQELWPRIKGYDQEIIAAGTFMPMAEKCGLSRQIDIQVSENILSLLIRRGEGQLPLAINLSEHLLTNKNNRKWLMFELMQLKRSVRQNLIIEVSEHLIEKDYKAIREALNSFKKIGCLIAVDNVGKWVINTEYILDFNIDYLKLHSSLVRDIHLRKTNQVAVQSLMASCLNSQAKVIAVGVEAEMEWDSLLQLGIYAGQGIFFSAPELM